MAENFYSLNLIYDKYKDDKIIGKLVKKYKKSLSETDMSKEFTDFKGLLNHIEHIANKLKYTKAQAHIAINFIKLRLKVDPMKLQNKSKCQKKDS